MQIFLHLIVVNIATRYKPSLGFLAKYEQDPLSQCDVLRQANGVFKIIYTVSSLFQIALTT